MMRRFTLALVLLLLVLPICAEAVVARNLEPREAAEFIGKNKDLYLLDVRTPAEYRQAHLAGSRLIPIDQVAGRLAEIPSNRPILVYCAVGSRSAQVVNYLARRGYGEIYNLYGGIYAWQQSGYPVLSGAP